MKRIAVFCTHPIQYFAPIWRMLASTPGLSVHVYYASDHSVRGAVDEQFGVPVKWDVPVLEGYPYSFMTRKSVLENSMHFFRHDRKDVDEILKKDEFDAALIFSYDSRLQLRILRAANRANIPVMLRGDNLDGTNPKRSFAKATARRYILKWLYKRIDAMCSVGAYTRRHYLDHGVPAERIFFSPHCVDDQLFEEQRAKFAGLRDEIRKDLGFESDDFVFMFSGKMIEIKNPLLIADALNRLPNRNGIGFLAVGEGKLRAEFERRMRECLGGRAVFTGFVNQSELGKYYTAADAMILPSWSETWGLVVNEAMIFGLPIIVSDAVGCREDLALPGRTGYIFPSGDPVALAESMMKLVQDPQRASSMGLAGSNLVRNYSVEAAVQGILEALKYVSERRT
jgi:glycosyltransferase involved in cell wall biosynthesis